MIVRFSLFSQVKVLSIDNAFRCKHLMFRALVLDIVYQYNPTKFAFPAKSVANDVNIVRKRWYQLVECVVHFDLLKTSFICLKLDFLSQTRAVHLLCRNNMLS